MRSLAAVFVMIVTACHTASCQAPPKGASQHFQAKQHPSNEGEGIAETMWEKILTTCQVPGSAISTTFFHRMEYRAHAYAASLFGRDTLFEYRGTWRRFYARPITEADRLNGVQFNGLAIIGATAVRSISNNKLPSDKWSVWESRTAKLPSPKDALDYEVLTLWDSVMLKVTIMKVNNKWIYFASDVPRDDISFDPDTISTERRSCSDAMSAAPFAANTDVRGTGK
jgi:hypothetical protein